MDFFIHFCGNCENITWKHFVYLFSLLEIRGLWGPGLCMINLLLLHEMYEEDFKVFILLLKSCMLDFADVYFARRGYADFRFSIFSK